MVDLKQLKMKRGKMFWSGRVQDLNISLKPKESETKKIEAPPSCAHYKNKVDLECVQCGEGKFVCCRNCHDAE